MELKEGAKVFTHDGDELGKVSRFVLDPDSKNVTHIVIQKGWLLPEDKVVPVGLIESTSEDKVVLNEDVRDFDQLPPFEETHFIGATDDEARSRWPEDYGYTPAFYWYPPYGFAGYPAYGLGYYGWSQVETERNIPPGTTTIQAGSEVISPSGDEIGSVEQVFMDPETNEVTHLLISRGTIMKEHKLIPTNWIKDIEEDQVQLSVGENVIEELPDYQS